MPIQRLGLRAAPGPVMSSCVIYGNMVYLAGVTARDLSGDVATQTVEVLEIIEARLAEAGTDKRRILTAQVWLSDMANVAAMNAVWNDWVDPEIPPARACVSGELFRPEALVEIVVTAVIEE
jgi:enamine deaminase RidA (YjgF/YER057c/UK114 family)